MKSSVKLLMLVGMLSASYGYGADSSVPAWASQVYRTADGAAVSSNGIIPVGGGPRQDNKDFPQTTQQESSSGDVEKAILSKKFATNVIKQSFQALENHVTNWQQFEDAEKAVKKINEALDNLGNRINNTVILGTLKRTADQTIRFFATKSEAGQDAKISKQIVVNTINALKTVLVTPVQLALVGAGSAVGATLGAAGGAVAGFGAGINQAAKGTFLEKKATLTTDGSYSAENIGKSFANVLIKSLVGVVAIPTLTAFGAIHGLNIGDDHGANFVREKVTGKVGSLASKSRGSSKDSSDSEVDTDSLTKKAQRVIDSIFTPLERHVIQTSVTLLQEQKQWTDAQEAREYLGKAIDKLGKLIGDTQGLKQLKSSIDTAITYLGTQETNPASQRPILEGIVRATKLVLTTPIKIAIQAGAITVGAGLGAGGAAVATVTVGLKKTAQQAYNVKMQRSLLGAVRYFPEVVTKVLQGVVGTSGLTVYNAAAGAASGGLHASKLAQEKFTGNWDGTSTTAKGETKREKRGSQLETSEEREVQPVIKIGEGVGNSSRLVRGVVNPGTPAEQAQYDTKPAESMKYTQTNKSGASAPESARGTDAAKVQKERTWGQFLTGKPKPGGH